MTGTVGSSTERSPRSMSTPSLRHARSRYTRLAVRGLVVVGFAGVAWLLASSAAHASTTTQLGSGDGSELTSLANVLGGDLSQEHQGSGAVLTTATGLLTQVLPTTTASSVAGPERSTTTTHAGGAGQGLLFHGAGLPVLQPVDAATSPLAAFTCTVGRQGGATAKTATTVPASARKSSAAKAGHTRSPHAGPYTAGATIPVSAGSDIARTDTAGTDIAGLTTFTAAAKDGPVKETAIQRGAGSRHRAGSGTPPAVAGNPIDSRRTHHVPLLPRPAPAPVLPGAGLTSGVPSMGSGLNQDGGAPAIVPVATGAATAATDRPDKADDVEVRTLSSESPTISPD
jgi:hypothetical protein